MQARVDLFIDEFTNRFAVDTEFFDFLYDDEKAVDDIYMNYAVPGVGDFKLKVMDASFIKQGVEYFRPFIRGFLILLLCLYNVRQMLSFIRQDAGILAGKQGESVSAETGLSVPSSSKSLTRK